MTGELGDTIQRARLARLWKQKELAAAVGVEPTTVSRWETGEQAPGRLTLRRLADVLEIPLEQLEDAKQEQNSPPSQRSLLVAIADGIVELQTSMAAVLRVLERLEANLVSGEAQREA